MASRNTKAVAKTPEPSRKRLAENFVPEVVDERPILLPVRMNSNDSTKLKSLARSPACKQNKRLIRIATPPSAPRGTSIRLLNAPLPPIDTVNVKCAIMTRKDIKKTTPNLGQVDPAMPILTREHYSQARPDTLQKQELCSYLQLVNSQHDSKDGFSENSLYQTRRSHRVKNNLLRKEKKELEKQLQERASKALTMKIKNRFDEIVHGNEASPSTNKARSVKRSKSVDTRQKELPKSDGSDVSKPKSAKPPNKRTLTRSQSVGPFAPEPEKVRNTLFMARRNGRLTPIKCITSTANSMISTDLQEPYFDFSRPETIFKKIEIHERQVEEQRLAEQKKAIEELAKLKEFSTCKNQCSIIKRLIVDRENQSLASNAPKFDYANSQPSTSYANNDYKINLNMPSTSKDEPEYFRVPKSYNSVKPATLRRSKSLTSRGVKPSTPPPIRPATSLEVQPSTSRGIQSPTSTCFEIQPSLPRGKRPSTPRYVQPSREVCPPLSRFLQPASPEVQPISHQVQPSTSKEIQPSSSTEVKSKELININNKTENHIPTSEPENISSLPRSNIMPKHSVVTLKRIDNKLPLNSNLQNDSKNAQGVSNNASSSDSMNFNDARTGEINKNLIFQIIGVTHYPKDVKEKNDGNEQSPQPNLIQLLEANHKTIINNCEFIDLTRSPPIISISDDNSGTQTRNSIQLSTQPASKATYLENDDNSIAYNNSFDDSSSDGSVSLTLNLSPEVDHSIITVSSEENRDDENEDVENRKDEIMDENTSSQPLRKKRKRTGILEPKMLPPQVPRISPRKRAKQLAAVNLQKITYVEHNYSKNVDVNGNANEQEVANELGMNVVNGVTVPMKQNPKIAKFAEEASPSGNNGNLEDTNETPAQDPAQPGTSRGGDGDLETILAMSLSEVPEVIPFIDNPQMERKPLIRCLVRRTKKKTLEQPDDNDRRNDHSIELDSSNGPVIRCFYFDYNLVITQSLCVSFWEQSGLGCFLESQRMWIPRGCIQRPELDSQCVQKEGEECIVNLPENGIAYVELWTKEHRSDFREKPACDVFVVVYFRRTGSREPEKKFIQLEKITGCADDVVHVVLRYANCVILSWKSCNGTTSPSSVKYTLRCYYFPNDYHKIILITEFQSTKHSIKSLHNIEDCDRLLLACGDGYMSIWNLQDLFKFTLVDLTNDMPAYIRNVTFKCDRGVLFALQLQENDDSLRLLAVNAVSLKWKILQHYRPPKGFRGFKGACIENALLVCFYDNGMVCWRIENGVQVIADEFNGDVRYWPSGTSIISLKNGQVIVMNVLSFILNHQLQC